MRFHFPKCSPLNETRLDLNEIAKFSSWKFFRYTVEFANECLFECMYLQRLCDLGHFFNIMISVSVPQKYDGISTDNVMNEFIM